MSKSLLPVQAKPARLAPKTKILQTESWISKPGGRGRAQLTVLPSPRTLEVSHVFTATAVTYASVWGSAAEA